MIFGARMRSSSILHRTLVSDIGR